MGLKKFSNYKKLYKISKKRSPYIIEMMTDDLPDEWLISVVRYNKKTEEVKEHYVILQKEVDHNLELYKKDNWIVEELT